MEAIKGGAGGGDSYKHLKRKQFNPEKSVDDKRIHQQKRSKNGGGGPDAMTTTTGGGQIIHNKHNFYGKGKQQQFIECGQKGFLITCNFHEKDCVRECYSLLYDYANKFGNGISNKDDGNSDDDHNKEVASPAVLQQKQNENIHSTADIETQPSSSSSLEENLTEKSNVIIDQNVNEKEATKKEDDEEDISKILTKTIKAMQKPTSIKSNGKQQNEYQFQQVETNITNCIFIKTINVDDPVKFGRFIIDDIDKTKIQRTRYTARFIPIEIICKANIDDIKKAVNKLIDKYFLNVEPTTYAIVLNRRYNNSIDRTAITRELAELITVRSAGCHKVDLTNPKLSIIVEIAKGLCCLSILPDYYQLRKYNLHEIVNRTTATSNSSSSRNPGIVAAAAAAADSIKDVNDDGNNTADVVPGDIVGVEESKV